jgi:hypothetical protein
LFEETVLNIFIYKYNIIYVFFIRVAIMDLYFKWMNIEVNEVYKIVNKKFREELIA